MSRYQVTVVRELDEDKLEYGSKTGFYSFEPRMYQTGFHSLASDRKKQAAKGFLRKMTNEDIAGGISLKKEERVIINKEGEYGLDKTVFDQEIKIPENLQQNNQKVTK